MNLSCGWNSFSCNKNVSSFSVVSVQIMNISSIYLLRMRGFIGCVRRKFSRIFDRNMLAIVGENGVPSLYLLFVEM